MQRKKEAPASPTETSRGNGNVLAQNISESSSNCNGKPLYSLFELNQLRTETVIRIVRLRRKGFWARQHLDSLREDYRDNVFALGAVDQLISISCAEGEGVLAKM